MFGLNKKEVKAPEAPEALLKQPVSSGLSGDERQTYIATAKRLGVTGSAVFLMQLEEKGFEVYPFSRVAEYLDRVYGESTWGWRGVRAKDVMETVWGRDHRECFLAGPYNEKIPKEVLYTVDKLKEAFPDVDLQFVISDKFRPSDFPDDPFLAVRPRGTRDLFVVERWDEPGFRL